jgi:copper transport protein
MIPGSAPHHSRLPARARIGLLVAFVAGTLVGPLALPASAHADVVKVSPAPAEVVPTTPAAVKVWFTEGVDVTIGGMFVYDRTGARVPTGPLRQPVPSELVLPIRGRLPDGPYVVTWRAVSEDSHPIQGTWTFRIGTEASSGGSVDALAGRLLAAQKPDPVVSGTWALARWLVYGFLALLVGGTAFGSVIWPHARDLVRTRRLVTVGWSGATAATVVGLFVFGPYSSGASASGVFDLG